MDRLSKINNDNKKQKEGQLKGKKEKKIRAIPSYGVDGKVIDPGRKKKQKNLLTALIIVGGIAGFLYIPQFFMSETEESTVVLQPDASAIKIVNNLLTDNGNEDFDGDGVINSDEESFNTSLYNSDTDGDSLSDYYEIHVSNTDPTTYDNNMIDIQKREDESNGKSLSSGYKIGNVILWADDYSSKAYGSVVETLHGYHFCNFNGYAEFSNYESTVYAYKVVNGIRTLLPSKTVNGSTGEIAWRVSAGDFIEVYTEPLTETIEVGLFGNNIYINSNVITKALASILPDKGFITMTSKMTVDVTPTGTLDTTADIQLPVYDSSDPERFMVNTNSLSDLKTVYNTIDAGGCVATSLYNSKYGEYVYLAYGYDYDGNLLMADSDSLESVGKLYVTPCAKKLINNTGSIVSVSYFEFSGFGFESSNNDRISFFAQKGASSDIKNKVGTSSDLSSNEISSSSKSADSTSNSKIDKTKTTTTKESSHEETDVNSSSLDVEGESTEVSSESSEDTRNAGQITTTSSVEIVTPTPIAAKKNKG